MTKTPALHISNNEGFSLVELLVVLTLIGMLSVFVIGSYFFASKSIYTWKSNLKLENSIHLLLSGIAEDVYKSEQIVEINDHNLSLEMVDGTINEYSLENGNLVRGDHQLQSNDQKVTFLKFSSHMDGVKSDFWEEGEGKNQSFRTILIQITISNGEDTLASKRAVSLRKPSLWKSLDK